MVCLRGNDNLKCSLIVGLIMFFFYRLVVLYCRWKSYPTSLVRKPLMIEYCKLYISKLLRAFSVGNVNFWVRRIKIWLWIAQFPCILVHKIRRNFHYSELFGRLGATIPPEPHNQILEKKTQMSRTEFVEGCLTSEFIHIWTDRLFIQKNRFARYLSYLGFFTL